MGNINSLEFTYAPGVSVFLFFPVLSPGGCESMWVAALIVVLPCAVSLCCWFLHCIHCWLLLYC